MKLHQYKLKIEWTGNTGFGTEKYDSYNRDFTIHFETKPSVLASADSIFRGDASKFNPEEMLLSALSSCHMLWFLHECADHGIKVIEYVDSPEAVLEIIPGKGGKFISATLNPFALLESNNSIVDIKELHNFASQKCFIANSCNFPITVVSNYEVKA